jgi:hypothetical protein
MPKANWISGLAVVEPDIGPVFALLALIRHLMRVRHARVSSPSRNQENLKQKRSPDARRVAFARV